MTDPITSARGSRLPDSAVHDALARRYGQELPEIGVWNETIALLLSHRSVRGFLSTDLPPGVLEALIAAASSAPTSSNLQAWSVIAVTDPVKRTRLAEYASLPEHGGRQQHMVDAPLILVWVADLSRAKRIADAAGVELESLGYTDNILLASLDAILAAQNALIAAESLGLGTVYIGALRNRPEDVAELLGLPPHAFAVAGLVVGYANPAVTTAVKPRLPQSVVLHRERYDSGQDAGIAQHDEATKAFRAAQNLPVQPWTRLVVNRLRDVATLHGREYLRETLARLGLPLK